MKPKPTSILSLALSLVLFISVGQAQQSSDDTRIAQMKATVQKLEGLAADENIPAETREQLTELLFEKRGELHSLLRQKRDALRTQLQGNLTPVEASNIAKTIQELNYQLQQLKNGNSSTLTRSEGVQTQAETSDEDSAASARSAAGPSNLSSMATTAKTISVPSSAVTVTGSSALRGTGSAPPVITPASNVPSSTVTTTVPVSSALPTDP